MQRLNYMTLLSKFRNESISGNDLTNLWECFSDKRNEDVLQELFLEDLNRFEVSSTQTRVDFTTIFSNIQNKIAHKHDDTFIYNTEDVRPSLFSENSENEAFYILNEKLFKNALN